jgi:hypothetical protein
LKGVNKMTDNKYQKLKQNAIEVYNGNYKVWENNGKKPDSNLKMVLYGMEQMMHIMGIPDEEIKKLD